MARPVERYIRKPSEKIDRNFSREIKEQIYVWNLSTNQMIFLAISSGKAPLRVNR